MGVNQTKNNQSWFEKHSELIGGIFAWSVIIGIFCTFIFWNNIEAFFASTPQKKCEAFLAEDNGDQYCKPDGTKGSRIKDEEAQCAKKTPYFKWDTPQNECERIKYASKQECINDGKQGVSSYEGEVYGIRCLDDGTWEGYDPEYESYLAEQAYEEYQNEQQNLNSNCHPSYSPCVPDNGYDLDCPDIGFTVTVTGYDDYRLDRDGDGYGCESY